MGVSGEVDMLCKIEAVKQFKEVRSRFGVRVIDMKVEITKEENGGGNGTKLGDEV